MCYVKPRSENSSNADGLQVEVNMERHVCIFREYFDFYTHNHLSCFSHVGALFVFHLTIGRKKASGIHKGSRPVNDIFKGQDNIWPNICLQLFGVKGKIKTKVTPKIVPSQW